MAVLYDVWRQGEGGSTGSGVKSEVPETEEGVEQAKEVQSDAEAEAETEAEDKQGGLMFSYAVLTTSSCPRLRWLHDRYARHARQAKPPSWAGWEGKRASASVLCLCRRHYVGMRHSCIGVERER